MATPTRAAAARFPRSALVSAAEAVARRMERLGGGGGGRAPPARYFSDSVRTGRVLGEEERAAENVYIQKMEREKLEKQRRKADQDKAAAAAAKRAAAAAKGDKKGDGANPN